MVQRSLLEQEGVVFDAKERVDFEQYGWEPERAWLAEHGFVVPPEADESPQPTLF
jgi:hypothetical protein